MRRCVIRRLSAPELVRLGKDGAGRDRLLSKYFHAPSGSFGYWAKDRPGGVFHTAMALGLLGSLPAEAAAPAAVLASVSAFLRGKQNQSGSFGVDPAFFGFGGEQALAGYVLHAQAPATLRSASLAGT